MLWSLLLLSFLLGTIAQDETATESKVVTIDQGSVKGYKVPGANVFAFYNIPYATAPTGADKFKAPLPPPSWEETFEAVDQQVTCPQTMPTSNSQEDCLIANIIVPDTNRTNLPVMVYVHGGAFQLGSGNSGSKFAFLSSSEIIEVNFNYRLGVHGFLCLGTEGAPGNAGMKDQLALLRWVQANIEAFGGNPDDVTIVGCSAGGASVDLLRLARVTDGLFQKVVAESGANAGSFGIQHDPLANAKFYAKALGFENVDDIEALTNFYTSASFETLLSRPDLISTRPDSSVIFTPCVEKDIGVERFLEEAPVTIMKGGANKAVPVLYGFSNMEGLIRIWNFATWSLQMNENFANFLPADLAFESDEEREEVAARVREFYFGDEPVSVDTIRSYIDYFSDVLFVYSMLRSVKLNAEAGNNSTIFLYEYSFVDENTPVFPGNVSGANHCNQIENTIYDRDDTQLTEAFINLRTIMRKMYSDFINTGNPVSEGSELPAWGPANANRDPSMSLGVEVSLIGPMHQDRASLWDEVYGKYYRTPIPPPGDGEDDGDDDGDGDDNGANAVTVYMPLGILYLILLKLVT